MAESIKGLQIKIGADTKEFQKSLKGLDKDINSTERQADALNKSLQLKFDEGRFTEAQRLAQEAITKTEQKAQALRDELKYLEDSGVDKTSESYKKLETQLIQTEAKAEVLKNKLKEINNVKLDSLSKNLTDFGNSVSSVGKAFMPLSLASAGMLTGLYKIGTGAVKTADDLGTLAEQVGLSAEELQKWQYIAMQTDVSDSQLQTGLTKVQVALGDLATGTASNATKALEQLGITSEKASKGMNANFEEIVTNLSKIEDPIVRASYANEIFGDKLGSKLIPLLDKGGEAISVLADEFENLDYLTNEQVEAFGEFDNVMNRIKTQFANIKNQLGYAILPVMQNIAGLIEEKIIPSIQKLSDWIAGLSEKQINLALKILAITATIGPLLMIGGKLIAGIGTIIKSMSALNGALTALSAHPIILIIGVIAGLLMLLYTRNEKFRESINSLIDSLTSSLRPVLDLLSNLLTKIFEALQPLLNIIMTVVGSALSMAIERLNTVIGIISEVLMPILDVINEVLSPIMNVINSLTNTLSKFLAPIIKVIFSLLQPLMQLVSGPLSGAFKAFGNVISKVFTGVVKVINFVLGFIEDAVNFVIDMINGLIRAINTLGGWLGISLDELEHVKIRLEEENPDVEKQAENTTESSAQQAVASTGATGNQTIVNNDYSDKDITINVTVQNYAEEIDTDALINEINMKLAEQL